MAAGQQRETTASYPDPPRRDSAARVGAAGALALAAILAAVVLLTSGSNYHVRLLFTDASGLVTGNQVMIGPTNVGTVDSISLTRNGLAAIVIDLDAGAAPLYRGTVARINDNGLASIAGHYITLEPAPSSNPTIPSGGTISTRDTYPEVSLDQLFDTLNPLTRAGLRNVIRGGGASIAGRARAANRTLEYFAPALYSTSQVTGELASNEANFDALLVQGAKTMQALAGRSEQLTELVATADQATGAIAGQSTALSDALGLLPATLDRSTQTFSGLRRTLDTLQPVVTAARPATTHLAEVTKQLGRLASTSVPTVDALIALIHNPSGHGDLTTLLDSSPGLASLAGRVAPEVVSALSDSQPQLDYLLDYTPDVVAALTNVGQASAYYDADGHYTRTQPWFGAFGIDAANALTAQPPFDRYNGLKVVHGRCPGGAVQPSPDHSAPASAPGCTAASSPPGP